MNRADKLFVGIVIVFVCLLYIPSLWSNYQNKNKVKEVVVIQKDQEILRKPLHIDAQYTVDGTMGSVVIEVLDGQVRVEKETSPYHLCSIQGWVDQANRPIVCLPNDIVVWIEAKDDEGLDVVIQ